MSLNLRRTLVAAAFLIILTLNDSDAFFKALHRLSGPGPFSGIHAAIRCTMDREAERPGPESSRTRNTTGGRPTRAQRLDAGGCPVRC